MLPEEKMGEVCDVTGAVSPLPPNPVVAMAYVPFQQLDMMYSPENGFDRGTIFPELYKPFLAGGGAFK